MESIIWIITIFAVILIVVIYVITSVGKYSNSFVGKVFKDKEDKKNKVDEGKS